MTDGRQSNKREKGLGAFPVPPNPGAGPPLKGEKNVPFSCSSRSRFHMFMKTKTYRDEEPFLLLEDIRNLFYNAQREVDFKKIGDENKIDNTVKVLVMLTFRLGCLCESILSCADYYTAAIVYRAVIEYSLKHAYIFMSCIKRGDDIAKEYVSTEHLSSEISKQLQKALSRRIKFTGEFADFQKRSDEISDKFKFGRVLESVMNGLHDDDLKKMLRTAAVQYSQLSSYVHAGPQAVLDLEAKPKKYLDMSSVLPTVIAYRDTIHLLSLYPSAYQDKLKALHREIDEKARGALEI